jgi:hypothetical protein
MELLGLKKLLGSLSTIGGKDIFMKTKFLGSNGKKGVSVYKPIDSKIFPIIQKLWNMVDKKTKVSKYISDNLYQIEKKVISKRKIKKIIYKDKLLQLNSLPYSMDIDNVSNDMKIFEFSKVVFLDINLIKDITKFKITKTNKKGKRFIYSIFLGTTSIDKKNSFVFIENEMFKHKIKMRMF